MSDPDVVSQNREYWNHLAPHRHGERVEFFLDGGSALTPDEIAAVGDVQNRRVLQLACSVGDAALTFAQHGATVTAVDLAPAHLATGRAKAKALGLDVTFVEQDMMTLDAADHGVRCDLHIVGRSLLGTQHHRLDSSGSRAPQSRRDFGDQ